jgi:hypothetical protein
MGAPGKVEHILHAGIAALNGTRTGKQTPSERARALKVPPVALAPLAIALVGAALFGRARLGKEHGAARKGAERRRPRNAMRYYGIGVLIGALERDVTRKVIIAALKYARQRA